MAAYQKPIKPAAENIDPMLRWIWLEMQRQKISQRAMAESTGFSDTSIRNWFRNRTSPEYTSVRAMVKVLGYDLFAEID